MNKSRIIKINLRRIISLIPAFLALVFLAFPYSSSTVTSALWMCGEKIIPTLFPFMVISGMAVAGESAALIGKIVSCPLKRFFRLPDSAGCAFIFGVLFGFPIGAKITSELCESGEISKWQGELLLALSSYASPAFVIGVVGRGALASYSAGLFLYISHVILNILICFAIAAPYRNFPPPSAKCQALRTNRKNLVVSFTESVKNAALGVISVCGYIVFFAVISEYFKLIPPFAGNGISSALISSVLELTAGIGAAKSLPGRIKFALCGFAVSFSGLSVFAQSASFASKSGIKLTKFALAKIVGGIATALVCYASHGFLFI